MNCNGYKLIYLPNHHMAFSNGCVYEHIVEAEKMLGRKLKKGEVVHHKDKNRENNSFNNLMVFASNGDHVSFHNGLDIVKINDVYVAIETNKERNLCPICGKEKSKTSSVCIDCCNKNKRKGIPAKEELESLLKLKVPFTNIGDMYGVSDNAVRKWCKYYCLPFRKKDLNKFVADCLEFDSRSPDFICK